MASVDKDPSRRKTPWVVRWRDEQGKQRKRGFARKLDADRFKSEVEHTLNVGSYVDPAAARMTFREYAERWRRAQPHRPNTATRTESGLRNHVYPVLGDRPLGQLRTSELQAFVTGLTLAASTVRTLFASVHAVLAAAVHDRYIPRDPSARVKLPALPRRQVVPLTVDQLDAITAALPRRYRAMVLVGAGAGLRQGEVFGLQVADVDFLRRTLTVERQAQPVKGGHAETCPLKNKHSYRTIPLGRTVVDALAAHLAEFPAAGEEHIFTDEHGELVRRQNFNRVWSRSRDAAGVPGAVFHDLRHTFASVLIDAGLSVKVVSERLGHGNAAMTLNVYAHLWPDDEDRTREAVDAALSRADVPTLRPSREA